MANKEQLSLIQQGIDAWNAWRIQNHGYIDLSGADLRGAYLRRAYLRRADLSRADLSDAELQKANLSEAYLSQANLRKADLTGADLSYVILREADLTGADLRRADLTGADLRRADLRDASPGGAILEKTILSSQSQLQRLARPLTDEQLISILFLDEIEFAKAGHRKGDDEGTLLRLTISGETHWTFLDMAGLLLAIQASYNHMHYLVTTEDLDIEHIRAQLTGFRRLVGVEDNIKVQSIQSGSLLVEISNLAVANKETIGTVLVAIATFITALMPCMAKYIQATAKKIEATAKIITAEAGAERTRAEAELIREEARKHRIENQKLEDERLKSDSTALAQLTTTPSVATSEYLAAHPCPEPSIKATLSRIQVASHTVEQNKYELFTKATHPLITMSFKLEELGHDRIQYEIVKKQE